MNITQHKTLRIKKPYCVIVSIITLGAFLFNIVLCDSVLALRPNATKGESPIARELASRFTSDEDTPLSLLKKAIEEATTDRELNKLENRAIEREREAAGLPRSSKIVLEVEDIDMRSAIDKRRLEITEEQRRAFNLCLPRKFTTEREDIQQLLRGLCYPEEYVNKITEELLVLLKRINFVSLVKEYDEDEDFVYSLRRALKQRDYLPEANGRSLMMRSSIPLYLLLIEGLDSNFEGEDILTLLRKAEEYKDIVVLYSCTVTAQLVYILLALSGREVKTCNTKKHVFVALPSQEESVAFIDFSSHALDCYHVVNLKEHYKKEGDWLVFRDGAALITFQDYSRIQMNDEFGVTPSILYNISMKYEHLDNDRNAMQAIAKAITLFPDDATFWTRRKSLRIKQLQRSLSPDEQKALSLWLSNRTAQDLRRRSDNSLIRELDRGYILPDRPAKLLKIPPAGSSSISQQLRRSKIQYSLISNSA